MTMALEWIFGETRKPKTARWAVGVLDQPRPEQTRIKLERARVAGTIELIQRLPNRAIRRESSPNGLREIQMPAGPQSSMFVVPVEQCESVEIPPRLAR
jgi:hypothetical protein